MRIKTVTIIPFYNHSELLGNCLRSVLSSTGDDLAVLVVDDSKDPDERDACAQLVARSGPRVKLVVNEQNLGFLQTTKRGALIAGETWPEAGFYLFLNSDIQAVVPWGWHEAMLEAFLDPQVGVCGARLVFPARANEKPRLQHAGVARTDGGWPFHPYCSDGMGYPGELFDYPPASVFRKDIHAVTGGLFMVRRPLWELLEGWDDKFGRGVFEDVDFCWRAVWQGWLIAYQPEATFIHHQSASREADGRHSLHDNSGANGVYLREKWLGIKSDEQLFGGTPRTAEEAEASAKAAAMARAGNIQVNLQLDEHIGKRLEPMFKLAMAGHPLSKAMIMDLQAAASYEARNQSAQLIIDVCDAVGRRGKRAAMAVSAEVSLKPDDMTPALLAAQAKADGVKAAAGRRGRHGKKKCA